MGRLLVESVTPLALEVALEVQREIESRLAEAEQHRQQDAAMITEEQKAKIRALASDFPKLWQDPKTTDRERKRLARLLLEDVSLRRDQDIRVQLRFRGGACHELHLPLPKAAWELRKTKPEIVAEIDRLLDQHTEGGIAHLLNERGWHSSAGNPFTLCIIHSLRFTYQLKTRPARLREPGSPGAGSIDRPPAGAYDRVCVTNRVKYWQQAGVLKGIKFGERNEYMYYPPTPADVEQLKQRRHKRYPRPHATQPSE